MLPLNQAAIRSSLDLINPGVEHTDLNNSEFGGVSPCLSYGAQFQAAPNLED
jgi:hypothetical protein